MGHKENKTERIQLIFIYRAPYSEVQPVVTSVFFGEFSDFLESAVFCASHDHLVITGDFNIHMDVMDDVDAIKLRGLLESTGIKQHVTIPTHISKYTLDLIITRLFVISSLCLPLGLIISFLTTCRFTASLRSTNRLSRDHKFPSGTSSQSTRTCCEKSFPTLTFVKIYCRTA